MNSQGGLPSILLVFELWKCFCTVGAKFLPWTSLSRGILGLTHDPVKERLNSYTAAPVSAPALEPASILTDTSVFVQNHSVQRSGPGLLIRGIKFVKLLGMSIWHDHKVGTSAFAFSFLFSLEKHGSKGWNTLSTRKW